MATSENLQPQYRLGDFTSVPSWRPVLKSYGTLKGKSMLEPNEVAELIRENEGMDITSLLQALVVPAAELALPYLSGYFVGAVALGHSGRIFLGANLEFPAGGNLSSSVHAEQCLTANLLRHGERSVKLIAISAPPCGHCRQFFSEYCCAESLKLIFGPPPKNSYSLDELIPFRFGPHDLLEDKTQPLLLEKQSHGLQWTEGTMLNLQSQMDDVRLQAAAQIGINSAKQSYTPYTRCPSAIVLSSSLGFHSAHVVESAAHSPTYQPLQGAFSLAMLDGLKNFSKVDFVILVELECAPLQQESLVKALLKTVSPLAKITVLHVEHVQ